MNTELLRKIAEADTNNVDFYVTQAEGGPLVTAGLVTVDVSKADPEDNSKRAVHITAEGVKMLQTDTNTEAKTTVFAVQTGIELPKLKRGGGGGSGAPTKYPFDTMEVGSFFFVANGDVKGGDAVKTVASATGAANQRYMVETGEQNTVTRAKRDNKRKAIKDENGQNIMETVTLPVKKSTRHFTVRPVEGGKSYGAFTAPADGAVVVRQS